MDSENKIQRKDYSFFKKVWYSITKFENYPEMAAYGVPRALIYLTKLLIIFSIVLTFIIYIFINQSNVSEGGNDDNTFLTKLKSNLNINLNELQQEEMREVFSQYDTKTLNIIFIIASGISIFISYFIITIVDILILSLFGMITCYFSRIKVKYRAIFNMSVYAITLPLILRLIYEALLLIFNFKIKYFDMMYTAIAYICIAAAIFMIKSDLIKQQIELIKVMEEKKKNAIAEEKRQKEEQDEEKKKDDENKNNDLEDKELESGKEQSSNA